MVGGHATTNRLISGPGFLGISAGVYTFPGADERLHFDAEVPRMSDLAAVRLLAR